MIHVDRSTALILGKVSALGFVALEVAKQMPENFPVSILKGLSIALCSGGLAGIPVTRNLASHEVKLLNYMFVASCVLAGAFTAVAELNKTTTVAGIVLGGMLGSLAISLVRFKEEGNIKIWPFFENEPIRIVPAYFAMMTTYIMATVAAGKFFASEETQMPMKVLKAFGGGGLGFVSVVMTILPFAYAYLLIDAKKVADRMHQMHPK